MADPGSDLWSAVTECAVHKCAAGRAGQAGRHGDYDEAFLDWIFWRYLATVEPTDRLIVARNLT